MPAYAHETFPRREILRRLVQNPDRGYTIEELADWWLITKKVIEAATEVKGALRKLCEEEFVSVYHERKSAIPFYKINWTKERDIKRLLDETDSR